MEIREHKETLLVNYLDFQIWYEEKKRNSGKPVVCLGGGKGFLPG
jgi:hypothetical protein